MGNFRFSFGRGAFLAPPRSELEKYIFGLGISRLGHLKSLSFVQLNAFPPETYEEIEYEGRYINIVIYKENVGSDSVLMIVQMFYSTWWKPNYLSLNFVGKMYVEGVLVNQLGDKKNAHNELLFRYL
jgi:hypothetical protein